MSNLWWWEPPVDAGEHGRYCAVKTVSSSNYIWTCGREIQADEDRCKEHSNATPEVQELSPRTPGEEMALADPRGQGL